MDVAIEPIEERGDFSDGSDTSKASGDVDQCLHGVLCVGHVQLGSGQDEVANGGLD